MKYSVISFNKLKNTHHRHRAGTRQPSWFDTALSQPRRLREAESNSDTSTSLTLMQTASSLHRSVFHYRHQQIHDDCAMTPNAPDQVEVISKRTLRPCASGPTTATCQHDLTRWHETDNPSLLPDHRSSTRRMSKYNHNKYIIILVKYSVIRYHAKN